MDRLDHRWSGLFFLPVFSCNDSITNKKLKSLRFLVQSNEFKNVFLHIIVGTVFIVPEIDRKEITGRKQFSVFPLA